MQRLASLDDRRLASLAIRRLAALALGASLLAACGGDSSSPSTTITVMPGMSIQQAVNMAKNGYTVEVHAGTYNEEIDIPKERMLTDFTLHGVLGPSGERPILEGMNKLQNGVFAAAVSGFTVENFTVQNYTENGVWVGGDSKDVTMRNMVVDHTGKYGLFPQGVTNALVEKSVVTHCADAAYYVGQSTGTLVVQDNEATMNVAGIECENSTGCDFHDNNVHDNAGGMLVFVLPHLLRHDNMNAHIHDNKIVNNNGTNFAAPSDIVSKVPSGTGLTVIGAQGGLFEKNTITGNQSYAFAVVSLTELTGMDPIDVPPDPVGHRFLDNTVSGNGTVDFTFQGLMLKAGDVAYDGTGSGDCQARNGLDNPRWVLAPLPTCM